MMATIGTPLAARRQVGGPLATGLATSAAVSWWLTGGIPSANCLFACDAENAANLAASYINLANPGTYDLAPGVAPTWASGTGWTSDGTKWLTAAGFPYSAIVSVIARVVPTNPGATGYYAIAARGGVFENNSSFDLCLRWLTITTGNISLYGRTATTTTGSEYLISFNPWGTDAVYCGTWSAGTNNHDLFENGTNVRQSTAVRGTDGSQALTVFKPNTIAGLDKSFIGVIKQLAIYDIKIDSYAAALSAAIAAL